MMIKKKLSEHLEELRKRLIYSIIFFSFAFILCYIFKNSLLNILLYPVSSYNLDFVYSSITDLFFFFIKISAQTAFLITIPFFLYQAWIFTKPALYEKEKQNFLPLIITSLILFLTGILFCFFLVMPMIIDFFITYNQPYINGKTSMFLLQNIGQYFSFFLKLLFAFGLSFELPVLLVIMTKLNLISIEKLKNFRRYFIVIAFVVAAILTPPDIISQTALALPLIALYELTLLYLKRLKK